MSNVPYNEDDGTLSKLTSLGIVSGLGYSSFKTYNEGFGWMNNIKDKVSDKIFKTSIAKSSILQDKILDTNNALRQSEDFAISRYNTIKESKIEANKKNINSILENGGKFSKFTLPINKIDQIVSNARDIPHSFTGLSYTSPTQITDLNGNPILDKLLSNIERTLGIKPKIEKIGESGTNVTLNISGELLDIPIPRYDEATKAWILKNKDAYSVVSSVGKISAQDGSIRAMDIIDPPNRLLSAFESKESILYYANMHDPEAAIDLIKLERGLLSSKTDKKVTESLLAKAEAKLIHRDIHEVTTLKRMVKNLFADSRHNTGADLAMAQFHGGIIGIDRYSLAKADLADELPGISRDSISFHNAAYYETTGPRGSKIEGTSFKEMARLSERVRSGAVSISINGISEENISHNRSRELLSNVRSFYGSNLSQSQTSDFNSSIIPPQTRRFGGEVHKGIKGYSFVHDITGLDGMLTKPLIWNRDIYKTAPKLYSEIGSSGVRLALSIADTGVSERIAFTGEALDALPVEFNNKISANNFISFGDIDNIGESINTKWFYRTRSGEEKVANSIYDLYNSDEINDAVNIWAPKGTAYGIDPVNRQLNNLRKEDLLEGAGDIKYLDMNFIQNEEDILNTLINMRNNPDAEYATIFGKSRSPLTKTGVNHDWRSTVHALSEAEENAMHLASKEAGATVRPVSALNFEFIKKSFPKNVSEGKTQLLKGGAALISSLQGSIAGHGWAFKSLTLDNELTNELRSILVDPNSFNGNIFQAISENGFFQFNQYAASEEKQLGVLTRVLGAIRGKYNEISTANKNGKEFILSGKEWTYEKAAMALNQDIAKYEANLTGSKAIDKPWFFAQEVRPHETVKELGSSNYTFKVGINDMPYSLPSSFSNEMFKSNISRTRQIYTESRLALNSLRPVDLTKSYAELGIPHLDSNGIDEMLGEISRASELNNVFNAKAGFLNRNINDKGFTVTGPNGRLIFFESAFSFHDPQYLSEEQRLAQHAYHRDLANILIKARDQGNGVIDEDGLDKLTRIRQGFHGSSKSGALKIGRPQIEGFSYGKFMAHSLLSNTDRLDSLGISGDLRTKLGYVGLIDERTYMKQIADEVEEAILLAGDAKNVKSVRDAIRKKLGDGNLIEQFIYDSDKVIDSKIIAERATKSSQDVWTKIESLLLSGGEDNLKKASELISESFTPFMIRRDPNFYLGSTSIAYGFASPSNNNRVDAIRHIFTGENLNIAQNSDWDGDAGSWKAFFSRATKESTNKYILEEQVKSLYSIKEIKDTQKMITESVFGAYKTDGIGFGMPANERDLSLVVDALNKSEYNFNLASQLTKRATGSAHTRAIELKSSMLNMLLENKELAYDEFIDALNFSINMPTGRISQGAISGKHTMTLLEENISKIDKMFSGIGLVTREGIAQQIRAMEGDTGALLTYSALNGIKKTNPPKFLQSGHPESILPELETFLNIQTGFKRADKTQVEKMLSLFGGEDIDAQKAATNYMSLLEEGKFIPLNERPYMQKAYGITQDTGYIEFFNQLSRSKSFKGSDSLDAQIAEATNEYISLENKAGVKLNDLIREKIVTRNMSQEVALNSFVDPAVISENIAQKEFKMIKGMEEIKNFIGPLTLGKVAGIGGAIVAGFAALNILNGDGTPDDINAVPSVNNPSLINSRSSHRPSIEMGAYSSGNMSLDLITNHNNSFDDSLQQISAMSYGRNYNTVSVRSDGTDPYKSDYSYYNK